MQGFIDTVSWLAIAATVIYYMKHKKLLKQTPYVRPAPNYDEPDVTRWKHDGTQDFDWKSGNRAPIRDDVVADLVSAGIGS